MADDDGFANLVGTLSMNRGTAVDMQQVTRARMYAQNIQQAGTASAAAAGGSSGGSSKSKVGFTDTYIYFSTDNQSIVEDLTSGSIGFDVPSLNNNSSISNCVGMRITSFYFPKAVGNVNQPDPFFCRRLMLHFVELPISSGAQAFGNKQFHYEFDIQNLSSIAVFCSPVIDTIYFSTPIPDISSLTFQFLAPPSLNPIVIPNTQILVQSVPNTNPARFTMLNLLSTALLGPHGTQPAPGVAVFIQGFVSGNTTLDLQVNDPGGWFVTVINSNTEFEVANIDFTVAPTNTTAYTCTMIIGKNRIAMEVQFTCVAPGTTNSIVVQHS